MEERSSGDSVASSGDKRYILKFLAGAFVLVLEYSSAERLEGDRVRVDEAGLEYEILEKFNVKFDKADLFMDLRSPVCIAQFDLEDWL
jgi:hypothetical protein